LFRRTICDASVKQATNLIVAILSAVYVASNTIGIRSDHDQLLIVITGDDALLDRIMNPFQWLDIAATDPEHSSDSDNFRIGGVL
jgi:hypothetical protein